MIALAFTIVDAAPAAATAAPAVAFRLRVEQAGTARIHAIALRCHVRIDARRRRYSDEEQSRLYELFGAPPQWDRTLQPVTWAQPTVLVPSFDRRIDIDVPVPCTYDLQVASAKYLSAIRDGDIPIAMLFSGTVFSIHDAAFAVERVPWDLEASFRLPAAVWQSAMDRFFPGGGWIRLQRDTLDRLQAFRGRAAATTWDQAIDALLDAAPAPQQT